MGVEENRRGRDAARSREAILDAAEALFAAQGFAITSLQEIGERAGVSRGTPGYFFGSKEALYRAVLERVFVAAQAAVHQVPMRAAAAGASPEGVLAAGIGAYLDFLAARPTFIRLVQWESLSGGRFLSESPPHLAGVQEALAIITEQVSRGSFHPVDPRQLLLSIMALCWFPLAEEHTLLPALGLSARDPAFLAARKQHVVELVLGGIRAHDASDTRP